MCLTMCNRKPSSCPGRETSEEYQRMTGAKTKQVFEGTSGIDVKKVYKLWPRSYASLIQARLKSNLLDIA